MSLRADIESAIVALVTPLVGTGATQFRHVSAVTKGELKKMLEQELPMAPFCLVSYAGRDGGFEGDHHQYRVRVSVIIGAYNLVNAAEKRLDAFDLMDVADGALMGKYPFANGAGPLENTGENLVALSSDGVEVWEQIYALGIKLENV